MDENKINDVIKILKKELAVGSLPIVSHLAENQRDPFMILISTLLSLRTKDEVTEVATERYLSWPPRLKKCSKFLRPKLLKPSIRSASTMLKQKQFIQSAET